MKGKRNSRDQIMQQGQAEKLGNIVQQENLNRSMEEAEAMTVLHRLPGGDIDALEEYCDLLYEDRTELKLKGIKSILSTCLHTSNLEFL